MTVRCWRTSSAAPSAAVTGPLPYTRVRWPIPWRAASASGTDPPAAKTSCNGATLRLSSDAGSAPSAWAGRMSLPAHRLPSWATFSSRVISRSSSSTRSANDRFGSCQEARERTVVGSDVVTRSPSDGGSGFETVSNRPGIALLIRIC